MLCLHSSRCLLSYVLVLRVMDSLDLLARPSALCFSSFLLLRSFSIFFYVIASLKLLLVSSSSFICTIHSQRFTPLFYGQVVDEF
jgi:hypothetical protein